MKVYIDSFVCSFVSFMMFLALFNYFKIKHPNHIILSFIFAIISFIVFFIFKNKNYQKLAIGKKENKSLKNFNDYLLVKNSLELQKDFIFYLQKAGYMPKKCKNAIVLQEQKTYLYLLFKFKDLCNDDIISLYKNTPKTFKTAIICTNLSEESKLLCSILQDKLTIVNIEKVYAFLKEKNLLPSINFSLTPNKVKLKIMLKECFNRKRCKHFFYIGTITLFFSLFVFYPKYYLIMGSLFCTYGLICLIYGKKNT